MSILGLGIDLVEIARIEQLIARHGARFLHRVFTDAEIAYCGAMKTPAPCHSTGVFNHAKKVISDFIGRAAFRRDLGI